MLHFHESQGLDIFIFTLLSSRLQSSLALSLLSRRTLCPKSLVNSAEKYTYDLGQGVCNKNVQK